MDIQQANLIADGLSQAIVGAVYLGLDYTQMAVDQAADPDVQALRLAGTGLSTMLAPCSCGMSPRASPGPSFPHGSGSWFSMLSMAFPTRAKRQSTLDNINRECGVGVAWCCKQVGWGR